MARTLQGTTWLLRPSLTFTPYANPSFDRVEPSRADFDEGRNQAVMRFNRNQPVWRRAAFESLVPRVNAHVPVKLLPLVELWIGRLIKDPGAACAFAASPSPPTPRAAPPRITTPGATRPDLLNEEVGPGFFGVDFSLCQTYT